MNTIFTTNRPSSETAFLPYWGDREYLQDQLLWLDACISFRLELRESEAERTADRIARYGELIESCRSHIESRLQASERESVVLSLPYLTHVFELTELEERAIVVCLAIELERKYETAFELLSGGGKLPTPDLVADLISRSEEERLQVIHALRADGLLRRQFMREDKPARLGPAISRPLLLDERIVRFAQGFWAVPEALREYVRLLEPGREPAPLLGNTDVQARLRRWLTRRAHESGQTGEAIIVSLWGRAGEGKLTQAEHIGSYFQEPLLAVDMAKLARSGGSSIRAALRKVYREATLQGAILVLQHFRAAFGEGELAAAAAMGEVLDDLDDMPCIAMLLSEQPCQPVDLNRRIDLELELSPLQDEELAQAWEILARPYIIEPDVDWHALAGRFHFTPGQIANALRTAKHMAESDWESEGSAPIGWKCLIQACYRQVSRHLDAKATRLSPKSGWSDLVLPDPQKEKLQHACNHIRHKHVVYGSWGFHKKLSYGTGISLLFSGPPGTGKTMAAEIIGKELDMEIYRVDLSQVISKYIGETEKNLRDIFDAAQASYAVLFFDEADALFGKRSEVKDSHDKNANTEVAFLLQKMEEYRGISIMATNFLQNIDEAFLRRINYIIRFPFPDEKQREAIWRRIYPAGTPLGGDIDFPFLASKLEVAGGSIKNIALTSAFIASGDREPVGMRHILKAYQYELDKTNRVVNRLELGEYGRLLDASPARE